MRKILSASAAEIYAAVYFAAKMLYNTK